MTTITTKKTGAGHYRVSVFLDGTLQGQFNVTDMTILDDIQELEKDGDEMNLINFDNFWHVIAFCVKSIEKN